MRITFLTVYQKLIQIGFQVRIGCVTTTTPIVSDVILKSSADSDPPVEPSTEQKPTSEVVTAVNEVVVIETTELSIESTNEDHSKGSSRKGEKKKGLLKSIASGLKKQGLLLETDI